MLPQLLAPEQVAEQLYRKIYRYITNLALVLSG
jgi:hypothetical protein